jgi:signal transduction histidine kinase
MFDRTEEERIPVRTRASEFFATWSDWACQRIIRVLLVSGVVTVLLVFWQLSRISGELVEKSALQNAEFYCSSLSTFRTLYTSEVVSRAKLYGMRVTHDYKGNDDAIPLPATLSMLLGKQIGDQEHDLSVRLYSDFPFPSRKDGGPQGEFEQAALTALRAKPDEPFYRFDEVDGRNVLRYAVSDRMRASCVSCHNSHPQSPKTDWRAGDVRGALHVSVPIEDSANYLRAGMRKLFLLMIAIGGAGVFGVAFVVRKFRTDADRMTRANQLLANQKFDLVQAQLQLEEANESIQKRAEQQQRMQRAAINIMKDTDRGRQRLEQTNEELASLQQEHLETARQAGMAEIATGVLHNAGNVLNSVNVSANLLTDRLIAGRIDNLQKAVAMLEEHSDDPGTFLMRHEKGRRLPGYLRKLSDSLSDDRDFMRTEVTSLNEKVNHIKEVIQVQQTYARRGGQTEKIVLSELVEIALKVNDASLGRHGIEIQREFDDVPMIETDKHHVLQILVNLISNARNAMTEYDGEVRRLTIRIKLGDDGQALIEVQDTGAGIAPDNLDRIFGHGFTTRKDGHGFGLHSSANAANELGGSLTVFSDGPDRGAVFTLHLPLKKEETCPTT